MKRHIRLDDNQPRIGKHRKRSPYEQYLSRICSCGHPGAHPPCSGCTTALSEEDFNAEYAEVLPSYTTEACALNEVIWNHHYDPYKD